MDRELEQFEAELKRLQPVAPPKGLTGRVAHDLERTASTRRSPSWWWWATAMPIAAGLAFAVTFAVRQKWAASLPVPDGEVAADEMLKPVAAENLLYAKVDEGVITLSDGTPVRRERLNFVDTFTWKNPRTNASLKWSVPREEIRVVPVSFQ
jgi:hypothetical protein